VKSSLTPADPPADLVAKIQEFFPESQWVNALDIAWLESGWNPDATNATALTSGGCGARLQSRDGVSIQAEFSIGYFQINMCNLPGWSIGALYRAHDNVGTAHHMWRQRGWQPWYFSAKALGLI